MVAIPDSRPQPMITFTVTWEKLPAGYKLEDKPVEHTGQPLLSGALRESLELAGLIQPQMLIASNFGICATINGELSIKAPDWLYVPRVALIDPSLDRKSYTPNLEGEKPAIVMEFLSDEDGEEYSVKRTFPPGKWFFYEQILQVPTYIIFEPSGGLLEVYRLRGQTYFLEQPDAEGRHWMSELGLFLGTWRGPKEGRQGYWLRWWDESGQCLPWAIERLEQERQRAERLEALLRAQGIDPEQTPQQ